MHPIERLRYVARAQGADPALLVRETAIALADVIRIEPAGLVPACRRLIDRHITTGPIWWLAARLLTSAEPTDEARRAAREVESDPTAGELAAALPEEVTAVIIGWPDVVAAALHRRGDVEALVAEAGGDGSALARRLEDWGTDAAVVPDAGVAAAVVVAGLVLIEAAAAGPTGLLATPGSHAAAAVAASAGVPVWAVLGVGRVLPSRMWSAMLQRVDASAVEPWERTVELVPAGLLTVAVTPTGLTDPASALAQSTSPVAAELLRAAG